MTGVELYDEVVERLAPLGYTVEMVMAQKFGVTLQGAMDDLNDRVAVVWKSVYFNFPAGWRYGEIVEGVVVDGLPTGVIRAVRDGVSIGIKPMHRFAGTHHLRSKDGTPGPIDNIWIARDHGTNKTLIGVAPRGEKDTWIHTCMTYPVPRYTDFEASLPVDVAAHVTVKHKVLAVLTEGDPDLHRKTFHSEHLGYYEEGVRVLRALVERGTIMGMSPSRSFALRSRVGRDSNRM